MSTKQSNRYTKEQLDFIRAGYALMPVRDLAPAFNAAFGTDKTEVQIRSTLKNHKITCGRTHKERFVPPRLFTPEHLEFLRRGYKNHGVPDLTGLFNERFGEEMTEGQIKSAVKNHGITSGRTGRFAKGQTSWNKGQKGCMGANATSFKKGNLPHNKRRLWSERISKDGYVEISVPERNPHTSHPTRFRLKHAWLWETYNGPVPAGHALVFRDGDRTNVVIENLMLVTRSELLSMNLHGYREMPDELKGPVLALARIEARAGFRLRPGRGRPKSAQAANEKPRKPHGIRVKGQK